MKPKNFPGRKEKRQKSADIRKAAYSVLTLRQKIANAELAPGESKKELQKLINQLPF